MKAVKHAKHYNYHPNLTPLFQAIPGGLQAITLASRWKYPDGWAAMIVSNHDRLLPHVWDPKSGVNHRNHHSACLANGLDVSGIMEPGHVNRIEWARENGLPTGWTFHIDKYNGCIVLIRMEAIILSWLNHFDFPA